MKFGYFCNTTNWNKKPYAEILDEARDISVYCDKNNWNSIWFTEHHFNHEGMESCPNPLVLGTDIAARTKNTKPKLRFDDIFISDFDVMIKYYFFF